MEKSNNTKMVEILRRLKPEMHGAVVGGMEERGVKYNFSYGVAVPVIRRVAAEYAPDPALAEFLFRQDIRELKLAAIYVDDPQSVTREQMERWGAAMNTVELIEHAAMALFYAAPEAEAVIDEWLFEEDPLLVRGALQMAGRRAVTGLSEEEEMKRQLKGIEIRVLNRNETPVRAAVYALCKIAGRSETLKQEVGAAMGRFRESGFDLAVEIASEVEALAGLSGASAG